MNIDLSSLTTYVLHCPNYPNRWNNIENMCKFLDVNPIQIISEKNKNYSHQKNIAMGGINLLNLALNNNKYPFLILEDDATLIDDHIPLKFEIPKDADLIYWGSNRVSGPPTIKNKLKIEEYNTEYYRIFNSQSTHAIVVPNKNSALLIRDIYAISFDTNVFHDVILPNISNNRIFLTPKNGVYFYQNDGRNHQITKFKWKNIY
jgi:hypothetical protein